MKNDKKYVLHISGLEDNCKYSYPSITRLSYSKFKKKNKEAIASGLITEINQKYNKHLYKILKKINKVQSKLDVKLVFINTDLLDKTIDLLFKGSLYSFKIHTASSAFDYKFGDAPSGNKQFPPFFYMDSFTGPRGIYSSERAVMKEGQSWNHFSVPGIKLPKDALYTEQTSVSHFDANEEGGQPETSPDFNESSIVFDSRNNNSTGKKMSIAEFNMLSHNAMLDAIDKAKVEPKSLCDKILNNIKKETEEIKTVDTEEQILADNDEYLKVINFINSNVSKENLKNNIMFCRYDIIVPQDFKERIASLLDIPDYESKFKLMLHPHQFLSGILHVFGDIREIAIYQLGELTFEELLELFTVLAEVSKIKQLDLDSQSVNIQDKEAEEIETTYTMAAVKDGQYLFLDDCTFKIGEDRSEAFNSILRAEGHREEVFYALYSFEDKVRCNYYINAANVKDKRISAVYVSSSYSDYNKNIVLREHQKADIEDVKLNIKMESNNEPTEEWKRIIHGNPTKHRVVLKNNSKKQSANNAQEDEMVFIITPRENDIFDIIYKSKSELETNEELINYKTKFINPSSNLFVLIKNHLLYIAESDNYSLTKEQISSVNKIYVPSHTVGLHYKITPAAGIYSLDIVFSYSWQEYDSIDNLELRRGRNGRKAFYDFEKEK